jgi:Zn-dependent protease with chaperone function
MVTYTPPNTVFWAASMEQVWARRLITALFLIALVSPFCMAQNANEDDDQDIQSATLNLRFNAQGGADVNLYLYRKIDDWNPVIAATGAALHCPSANFAHPSIDPRVIQGMRRASEQQRAKYLAQLEDSNQTHVHASCPSVMQRTGLLDSRSFDFSTLTQVLRQMRLQQLTVYVSRPDSPSGGFSQANQILIQDRTRRNATYAFTIDGTDSPALMTVSFGLERRDVERVAAELLLYLAAPAMILGWLRRAALRRGKEDRIGAWFTYFRAASLVVNGFVLLWFLSNLSCREQLTRVVDFVLPRDGLSGQLIHVCILFTPALLVYLISVLLSHRVFVEVRGTNWNRRNYVAQQMLRVVGVWLPVGLFFAGIPLLYTNPRLAICLFGAAFVARILCAQWTLKLMQGYPQPLTTGDLRDRIMAMAQKIGVKVKNIMLLPAGKAQMANAFAAANNNVMFTDYLLQKLTRREVDAVAAHELTHLKKQHPAKLVFAMLAAILSPKIFTLVFGFVIANIATMLRSEHTVPALIWSYKLQNWAASLDRFLYLDALLIPAGLAGFYLLSRRFEHQADMGAVAITQDPEAMISGLVKLGGLNLMPIQWSKKSELMLTHPSMVRRAEYIAKHCGIGEEQLRKIIANAQCSAADAETAMLDTEMVKAAIASSPQPLATYASEVSTARMQSPTAMKSLQRSHRNLWILIAAHCVPPAVAALLIVRLRLADLTRSAAYVAGAILTLALYTLVMRMLALSGRNKTLSDFRNRFESTGVPVSQFNGMLVGFSPGPSPRFYMTSYDWDRGFLLFTKDRLCYIGEQSRLSLTPDQIVNVQLGPGAPSWWKYERLYVSWRDASTGRGGTFNLSAAEPCSLFDVTRLNQSMQQRVLDWWRNSSTCLATPAEYAFLEPPAVREVTCKSPKEINSFRQSFKMVLLLVLPASLAVATLMRVSFGYVFGVALLIRLFEKIPYWQYRDPVLKPSAKQQEAMAPGL